jgi:hypothetical protein
VDDPSKTLLIAAFGSALTLVILGITKAIEYYMAVDKEKRDFTNARRNQMHAEIEALKNEVGIIYELAANWQDHASKAKKYFDAFDDDYKLIGKYNKYREVASAARDTIHLCKVVAYFEMDRSKGDVVAAKLELTLKYREFLAACDGYLDQLSR